MSVSGTTSGIFVNPNPSGGSIVTTGVGTSNFTWGDGSPPPPNSLSFAAAPFSTTTETPFKIGTLTYFNGTTVSGTTPNSIDLKITLNFGTPPAGNQSSSFTLMLDSTPNTGTPQQNADYVYFPSAFSNTTFMIGGTTYTLKLTGFQNVRGVAGFLGSNGNTEFHVEEGGTASADLYGVVTSNLSGIAPEPVHVRPRRRGACGLIAYGLRRRRNS